ncbi:hypothetical protein PR003_g9194 [Phytophthora rubi]|uniref:Uncharacterized protein n=1 Tax=Phytophthora rubi TaxID=129364 RepID=A0A6A3KD67_9STRA|nr:hypothetical protein PR002_g16781 [Phytophthora rubi]KAE9342991.1 hypothetical protein PR003_g9194 [Phytophthora rubi]
MSSWNMLLRLPTIDDKAEVVVEVELVVVVADLEAEDLDGEEVEVVHLVVVAIGVEAVVLVVDEDAVMPRATDRICRLEEGLDIRCRKLEKDAFTVVSKPIE